MAEREHFSYRDGRLQCDAHDLVGLADEVGTPFYCYSSNAMAASYRAFQTALEGLDASIFYAVKANGNQAVLATFGGLGAGADVVSVGEMHRALAAGIAPQKIIFAGVGKTAEEMATALDAGILQFNLESLPELERLNAVALGRGTTAAVALRVNPDVDALTHKSISTGKADNKFGIEMGQAREVALAMAAYPGLRLEGLAMHIGSQITKIEPYREAFARLAALYRDLKAAGVPLRRLDMGGGIGVTYQQETPPSFADYAAIVGEATAGLGAELAFEPGRALVGNAGILVTRVVYVKDAPGRRFVVIDAAMNDLIRPMLYEAWHDILPLRQSDPAAALAPADVVGPICESTDTFARDRDLPPLREGDLLAIMSAGAYGAVMSSTYNGRLLVPEVMVRGTEAAVIRPRTSFAELIAQDRLPPWLDETGQVLARGA